MYEGFPGEVKTFFVRGLMFPNEEVFSSSLAHGAVSAASPICSDFQTFCPDWLHFGHFLCFGGIAASQLSHRIFPIYF